MKKVIFYSGAIGLLLLHGCANENKSNSESSSTPVEQSSVDVNTMNTDSSVPVPSEQTIVPVQQTAPVTSSAAVGMNPAHGEPGHRCDIAVGAPLNSPPGKKDPATPAVSAQPVTAPAAAPAQTSTAKVPTAPGMNPPHGEPGHDCAIAVGAPLKK